LFVMRPERWKQVEEILEAALERAPERRAAFLAEACAGDDGLRREVETLIRSYDEAGDFIDAPIVPSLVTTPDATYLDGAGERASPASLSGRLVGAYRLVSEIGRGGMGTVYLAMRADNAFRRRVAVKLVKRGMDTDFILRRFRRERQILAALDHPNIAALLDGGSTEDGLPYFVMEYIEGQPIHRYSNERRLTVAERLRLVEQVCAAVAYAHRKQIVHRDLKPGNILVTSDGVVKLLDFGIAKLLDAELASAETGDTFEPTATAMRLMTPEYASPEQVRGQPVTPASDVYSLGVLLYELLTGHRPYRLSSRAPHELARVICEEEPTRPSAAVNRVERLAQAAAGGVGAALALTPESVSAERGTTPEALREALAGSLDNLILKAMQKDVEHRYASAAELAADIARHLAGHHVSAPFQAFAMPEAVPTRNFADDAPTARSVAVLPLKVMQATRPLDGGLTVAAGRDTGEDLGEPPGNAHDRDDGEKEDTGQRYLGVGVADALVTQLSAVRGLVVRPTSAVLKYTEAGVDPFKAGRELGVDYVLDGRIQLSGGVASASPGGAPSVRLRVTVQLVSVREKSLVWAGQFDERSADILGMQDAIASQVAEALAMRLTGDDRARLARRGTEDPRAYEAYLRGRYHWYSFTVEGLAKALLHFNEAISIDPSFAAPYAGVAEYYNRFAMFGVVPSRECFAAAKDAARKAVLLDETLAEAWAALAFATLGADWDWGESARLINRATELDPRSVQVHEWRAFILAAAGQTGEAVAAVDRAAELDPHSSALYAIRSFHLHLDGRQEESLASALRSLELDPDSFWAVFAAAMENAKLRRHAEAVAAAEKLVAANAGHPMAVAALAFALAVAGRREEARAHLRRMLEVAREGYLSPYYMAFVYEELGERGEALAWAERGVRERDSWMLFFAVEPWFAALRAEERGRALLSRTPLFTAGEAGALSPASPRPAPPTGGEQEAAGRAAARPVPQPRAARAAPAVAVLLLAAVAAFALYKWLGPRAAAAPFQSVQSVKLTTTGNAVIAAVSPDGKYVAYVTEEGGEQTLWLRQTAVANSVRVVPPAPVEYRGLTFSPDGGHVYYVAADRQNSSALYRVASIGGVSRKLKDRVDSPVGFSADRKRFAFVRRHDARGEDELIIADAGADAGTEPGAGEGAGERRVAARKFPDHFSIASAPAWSPDGGRIAIVVLTADRQGFFMKAVEFRASDGAEQPLTAGRGKRWMVIDQMAWLPDGGGWLMAAQDAESPFLQLWAVGAGGEARRLTNDMGDYKGVSLPSDLGSVVAVHRTTLTNIWTGARGQYDRLTQLTAGAGRYFDLSWTPDGQILYASDATGSADIWEKQPAGGEQRQLTAGAARNYAPLASPDGRLIVFHSNRGGNWQVWRMNRDGSFQTQLTSGDEESNWPQVTPDGKWVVYEHVGAGTLATLWKMPVEGGEAKRLTSHLTLRPAVSPDGKLVACWRKEQVPGAPWRIALIPIEGGEPVKFFDTPQGDASGGSVLRWMPDGRGLVYIDFREGVTSLWHQPLDGGAPQKIMTSAHEIIYAFDIARDGRIVVSRGLRAHDVVLITDAGRAARE
jgi:eukaryotic-like serine/threonine-protein kinase